MPSYYRLAAEALPDPGTSGTWERRLAKGLQRLGWLDGRRILSLGTAAPLLKDIDESLIPRDPDLTGATLSQRLVGGSKRDLWLACLAAVDYVATHPHEFSFGDYPSDTPLEEVPGWSQDPGNEPEPGDLVVVNGLIALGRLIEDAIAYLVAPGNTSNRQAKAIMQNIADQLGYIAPLIIDADNWVGTTYDPATGKIKANKSVNGVISALGEVVQNVSLGDEIGGITWAGNYYITYNDVAIAGPFDIDNVFDDARRSGLIAEGTAAIWISAFESAPQSSEPVVVPPEQFADIEFVGSINYTFANGVGGGTVSFSSLRNEAGVQPTILEGDLVVVTNGNGSGTNEAASVLKQSDYSIAHTDLYADDTGDTNLLVSYKVMTSTPDSGVTLPDVGGSFNGLAGAVHVFRNVDPNNPLDVASTTAIGTNTCVADPPSITPETEGAWVLAAVASASNTTPNSLHTNPSGFSAATNHFRNARINATIDISTALAVKTDWTAGAVDLASGAMGGTAAADGSWASALMVLRPKTL